MLSPNSIFLACAFHGVFSSDFRICFVYSFRTICMNCTHNICVRFLVYYFFRKRIFKIFVKLPLMLALQNTVRSFFFAVALQPNADHGLLILDIHTQWRTTFGRTPLDEWSALLRDLYLTTHNTSQQTDIHAPVGLEPSTSETSTRQHTTLHNRQTSMPQWD